MKATGTKRYLGEGTRNMPYFGYAATPGLRAWARSRRGVRIGPRSKNADCRTTSKPGCWLARLAPARQSALSSSSSSRYPAYGSSGFPSTANECCMTPSVCCTGINRPETLRCPQGHSVLGLPSRGRRGSPRALRRAEESNSAPKPARPAKFVRLVSNRPRKDHGPRRDNQSHQ